MTFKLENRSINLFKYDKESDYMKKLLVLIVFLVLISNVSNASDWSIYTDLKGLIEISNPLILRTNLSGEIHFKRAFFDLSVGYNQLNWGQGETSSLILSKSSPNIPYMNYEIEWWKLKYNRFVSPLENNRWLFGQRIDLYNYHNFNLGAYELLLCSDKVFYGYYIPVPLIPYYALQRIAYDLFESKYDYNSNVMIGFDFNYAFDEQKSIYGEILIDDFPDSKESITPKKAAGLIGVRWEDFMSQSDLWSEYVRINNFVYTHRNPSNQYLFKNQPLGHWMGMDGDLWAIGVNQVISDKSELKWQLHYIRKGEGTYSDNWENEFLDQYTFLTGIVETSYEIQIDLIHQFKEQLRGTLCSVIGFSNNTNHVENAYESYWKSTFTIIYDLF